MRVIGIDPGYDRVGIAVVEHTDQEEKLIYSTCLLTEKKDSLDKRIVKIGCDLENLITKYQPDGVALETIFFNKNIKTAINVAQARGALVYISAKAGCRIYEFGPQEIKVAITGYGNSDKTAVYAMISRLIRYVPEKALDDEYDAIAVGVTCLAHYRRDSKIPS